MSSALLDVLKLVSKSKKWYRTFSSSSKKVVENPCFKRYKFALEILKCFICVLLHSDPFVYLSFQRSSCSLLLVLLMNIPLLSTHHRQPLCQI